MCEHDGFYEDTDGIYRCSDCHKVVDPDELEWAMEEANGSEEK